MVAAERAAQLIADAIPSRPSGAMEIAAARGHVLAESVLAERDQPPFDRVMMDGIAIAHAALAQGTTVFFRQGIQPAGSRPLTLADNTNCIEVMTGAVLPEHCDCVIPVEQVSLDETHASPDQQPAIEAGQFIHRRGSDYRAGQQLLDPGTRIGGPEMAVLASAGNSTVTVALPPTIEIIAVGDELVDPGADLAPWQIRRSNDFAIETLLHEHQLTATARSKLPDDAAVLESEIGRSLDHCDVLVLTGGVSMGRFDYIPGIMQRLGVEIILHGVAQAPGKPMWVGRRDDVMVFALPGNPVSALVCARRYVVTAIHTSMGWRPSAETVMLAEAVENATRLTRFVPVLLECRESGMAAIPHPTNTSGDFHALAGTAGFVALPPGVALRAGTAAEFWRW